MNLYFYFYCKAFDWYNTTGKKDKDPLRVSAIALLSAFQGVNLLSVIYMISLLQRRTPINKWIALILGALILGFNFFKISTKKSKELRNEFSIMPNDKRKRLKVWLTTYIFLTALVFLVLLGLIIYIKKTYGNYDLQ